MTEYDFSTVDALVDAENETDENPYAVFDKRYSSDQPEKNLTPLEQEVHDYYQDGGGVASSFKKGLLRANQTFNAAGAALGDSVMSTMPASVRDSDIGRWLQGQADEDKHDVIRDQSSVDDIPVHPTTRRMYEGAGEGDTIMDGVKGMAGAFWDSPNKAGFAIDTLVEQAPVIAATAIGTKGMGGLVGTGSAAAKAATFGTGAAIGSGSVTFGSNVAEALGADISNWDEARDYAFKRSLAQGIVDGTVGAVVPFKIGGNITNVSTQAILQAAGGSLGEAAGATAVGEEVSRADMLMEGVLELLTAPADLAMASMETFNPRKKVDDTEDTIRAAREEAASKGGDALDQAIAGSEAILKSATLKTTINNPMNAPLEPFNTEYDTGIPAVEPTPLNPVIPSQFEQALSPDNQGSIPTSGLLSPQPYGNTQTTTDNSELTLNPDTPYETRRERGNRALNERMPEPNALGLPAPDSPTMYVPDDRITGNANTGLDGMPTRLGRMDSDPIDNQIAARQRVETVQGGERVLANALSDVNKAKITEARSAKLPPQLKDQRLLNESYRSELEATVNKLDEDRKNVNSKSVNPETDDLFTAIAKKGGIDKSELSADGFDPKDLTARAGVRPVFSKKGRSVDDMAESLVEDGYLQERNVEDLKELIRGQLGGKEHYSSQASPELSLTGGNIGLSAKSFGVPAGRVQSAINKALEGKKLTANQVELVKSAIDEIEVRRSESVRDVNVERKQRNQLRKAIRNARKAEEGSLEYSTQNAPTPKYYEVDSSEFDSILDLSNDERVVAEALSEAMAVGVPASVTDELMEMHENPQQLAAAIYEQASERASNEQRQQGNRHERSEESQKQEEVGERQEASGDLGREKSQRGGSERNLEELGRPGRLDWTAEQQETGQLPDNLNTKFDPPQEGLLSSYTEAELKQKSKERKAQEDAEAKALSDAETKEKADNSVDDFDLIGSNLPADANPKQGDVFDEASDEVDTRTSGIKTLYRGGDKDGVWWSDNREYAELYGEGDIQTQEINLDEEKFFDWPENEEEGNTFLLGLSEQETDEALDERGYSGVIIEAENGELIYRKVGAAQDDASATPKAKKLADKSEPKDSLSDSSEPLEDFGEKLQGARKDMNDSFKKSYSVDDIRSMPLSKIWPKKDLASIDDKFVAAFATAARDEIPSKPRKSYKLDRWVETVKTYRELVGLMLEMRTPNEIMSRLSEFKDGSLNNFASKVKLLQSIEREYWSKIGDVAENYNAYTMKDGKEIPSPYMLVRIDGRAKFFHVSSMGDAIGQINEALNNEQSKPVAVKFEIRGRKNNYYINKKGDSEYRKLKSFTDLSEARAYLNENSSDLVDAWEAVKARDNIHKSDMRSKENSARVGEDYRSGKDVTVEEFEEAFGFRGVQFGNWVKQGKAGKDRQGMLNQAYDALMDLSTVVGVPTKAISLNGELGLAFGARGSGNAAAHYEPSNIVINLTKTSGAGSLAHEWFHALDHYFQRKRSEGSKREDSYITYNPEQLYIHKTKQGQPTSLAKLKARFKSTGASYLNPDNWKLDPNHKQGVRPEVEERFAAVVEALDNSPMLGRSLTIDKGRSNGYWSRIIERAARAFENYTIAKMQEKGLSNDFLANVSSIERFSKNPGRYPYLLENEIAPVQEAFDDLFGEIKTKETENGIALLSIDSEALAPKLSTAGKGAPVTQIKADKVISRITANWKNGSDDVRLVDSFEDLPIAIKMQAEQYKAKKTHQYNTLQ